MKDNKINHQLIKCMIFTIPQILFFSATANLFRNNIILVPFYPFYYLYKIYNIGYLFLFFSLFLTIISKYFIYTNRLSAKKYLVINFFSKFIFLITFRISLQTGVDIKIYYTKNVILLFLISLFVSLYELLENNIIDKKEIQYYKPKGYILSLYHSCIKIIRNATKRLILPIIFSFVVYYFLNAMYYRFLRCSLPLYYKLINFNSSRLIVPLYLRLYYLFSSYLFSLISVFFYYLFYEK